jgi:hypothetical protein
MEMVAQNVGSSLGTGPGAGRSASRQRLPQRLGDIIVPDRERMKVALATPGEVAAIAAHVEPATARDMVSEWRFVAIRNTVAGTVRVHLLGIGARRRQPLITSQVVAFDAQARLARTLSGSLYTLAGRRADSEPPPEHIAVICSAMHAWGLGTNYTVTRG